jgi:hypothetical protein
LTNCNKLDGKTTTHTIHVTTVEETVKKSRWGGFVDRVKKFANGGSLSGYGGGDIVNAKLEPGEYVLRKEAVRNVGVGILNAMNNMKMGASDILSSIKATNRWVSHASASYDRSPFCFPDRGHGAGCKYSQPWKLEFIH